VKPVFFLSSSNSNACAGEWDHFLYVGKIALFGWILHYGTSLVHRLTVRAARLTSPRYRPTKYRS